MAPRCNRREKKIPTDREGTLLQEKTTNNENCMDKCLAKCIRRVRPVVGWLVAWLVDWLAGWLVVMCTLTLVNVVPCLSGGTFQFSIEASKWDGSFPLASISGDNPGKKGCKI